MCRNHSHLYGKNVLTFVAEDGLSVALVAAEQDLTVETSIGMKLTLTSGATCLIVVPSQESASSFADRVMAALSELLSTDFEAPPSPVGNTSPLPWSPRSGAYSTN